MNVPPILQDYKHWKVRNRQKIGPRQKQHPRRPKTREDYRKAKVRALNQPGPSNEADLVRALRYEGQGGDARLFQEALSAESKSWSRR